MRGRGGGGSSKKRSKFRGKWMVTGGREGTEGGGPQKLDVQSYN